MNWRNRKSIYCLAFSDVHTGHPNTPTDVILDNLRRELDTRLKERIPDFIFIPGDFFDRLLNVPNAAVMYISGFIFDFLRIVKKHNIRLRILEGTPSHDWKQNYLFEQINADSDIQADVRYVDNLFIGYEEDFDMRILYIPDEWHENPKDTEYEVLDLMQKLGIERVDLAIMHGMFEFQVPSVMLGKLPAHDQTVYETIVDQLIIIGHDHKHKRNGKVVVPGSFDRLAHGEEDPKGYISFELKPNGNKVTFYENKGAAIYQTIDLTNYTDLYEALQYIEDTLSQLPRRANVRFKYIRGHAVGEYLAEIRKKYSEVRFSKPKIVQAEEETVKSISAVFEIEPERYSFNQYNLVDKLMEEVERRHPELDHDLARSIIKEVIDHV